MTILVATPLSLAALLAAVPLASAAGNKRGIDPAVCAQYENSVQQVPDWYADVCLGGNAVRDYSSYTEAPGLVPGDIAFYKTNFPAPLNVKTAPLQTLAFTTVGANAQPLFAMAFNPAATILYAVDNTSRQLGTIDQVTGAFTAIGLIHPDPGTSFTVLGLAFDPSAGGQGYLSLSDGAPSGALLFRIDVTDAALTAVGPITNIPFAIDLAIDGSGQMWSHDVGGDFLLRVDKNTGAPTVIGPTGMQANFAQGMMYDYSDNTLYGCAFVTVPAQQGQLVVFNQATGAATVVAGAVPDELECAVDRAVGPCTVPIFGGLVSAVSAGTGNCAVNLTWLAGTPCGPTTLKYNVYRSTSPNTPPSAATLIASCLNGLTYQDTTATGGTRYYYKVRAEDNTATGSGPCNSGRTDSNNTERSVVPSGPPTTTTDDVESGGTAWDATGGTGTNPWSIVDTAAHSPTHSWFWPDPAVVTLQPLTRVASFTFGVTGGRLSWWHRVLSEPGFDGYVLEYSLDNGTTWSDILLGQGPVNANPNRFLQNAYNATLSTGFGNPLPGRQAWAGTLGNPNFAEVIVDMNDFANRAVKIRWRAGSDNSVSATGIWVDDISLTANGSCGGGGGLIVPSALAVDAAGNGVYQPNETVTVAPSWRNFAPFAVTLSGALTNHTGPAGPTYAIPDGAAGYGTIPVGGTASCAATSNCYSVSNTVAARPATHWDTTAIETVTPTSNVKTWTLHVGDSFSEVPPSSPFYRFIEMLLHRGITGGCSQTEYCPSSSTTREQMAVFAILSKEPPGYVPAACLPGGEVFADVLASSPFCRWIEELARRGVVSGCGNGNYCPGSPVTRDQMAIFVLRTLDPTLTPPACVPPNIYNDVPESSPFCRWIEELTNRGVVSGCGAGNYCPTNAVTREQMGVFLAVTFALSLYGI